MPNSLISSTNLVQVPQIIVTIGDYTFGSYSKENGYGKYPNYVRDLNITKINGRVNTYTLTLAYLITEYNDPNFFEKVFSSVSKTRKIRFTYGDCAQKNFMYREEEAIITSVSAQFQAEGAAISYTVKAVSSASLAASGAYSFPGRVAKPSTIIYELLANNKKFGLQDLFTGMRDLNLCRERRLIADSDIAVSIETQTNMSVLDYLQYLVSMMTSSAVAKSRSVTSELKNGIQGTRSTLAAANSATFDTYDGVNKKIFYVLKYIDDTTDVFHGPYFQVVEVNAEVQHPEAYDIDYGYPGNNLVRDLQISNNENYSIYYDYQNNLHPQEYISRLNPAGEYEEVYAPILSSKNDRYQTRETERSWWSKVSQYPIRASITIKGLLRPAILMSYLRLNIIFFGKKHIHSGLYIITKQEDSVSGSGGFSTRLDLVRVAGSEEDV